ncbi:hypothetical protein F5Y17DRAFT_347531 [Xylariaceae sp. FL0594]|nr:hypothetical protein F5Y17DRAFT_347531 [Xylariaceae sp. FL0594]
MDVEASPDNLQSEVLRNTLAEIAAREEEGATSSQGKRDGEVPLCCVICLESVTEACEARPCRHANFDYLCILSWLERSTKCPLCKSDVHEVVHDFDYDGCGGSRVYLVPQKVEKTTTRSSSSSEQEVRQSDSWRSRQRPRRPPMRDQPVTVTANEAILCRQEIYRKGLYSLHVGANPLSRHRDITPATFESEPELVSRARAWLRRELQVFEFLRCSSPTPAPTPSTTNGEGGDAVTRRRRRRQDNAEFLLEYIVAILKTVDIKGSQGAAEDMLAEFLGRDNARLLLHELRAYLRSPWSMEVWDRKVQYPTSPPPAAKGVVEADDRPVRHFPGPRRARGDSYRPSYHKANKTPYERVDRSSSSSESADSGRDRWQRHRHQYRHVS